MEQNTPGRPAENDTQKEGGSDPTGASSGISRIARGGNWSRDSSYCAVSSRSFNGPSKFIAGIGFRVVRTALTD